MKRVFVLLLTALLLTACASVAPLTDAEDSVPVYYLAGPGAARGSDAICCSYEKITPEDKASPGKLAAAVIERLISGSEDPALISPFPADVRLLSLEIVDRHAYVDFVGSYALLNGIDLTMADYCLTLSLTSIEGIDSVSVTVGGRALTQHPRQIFRERDIILSSWENSLQLVDVKLYFLNEEGALVGEDRTLELYEGDTQSAALIAALLAGPADSALQPVIPDDLHIMSIKTENGVCRINFAPGAVGAAPKDEDAQRQIIYSLAGSLYSLEYIREISILSDGTELERFGAIPVSEISHRENFRIPEASDAEAGSAE